MQFPHAKLLIFAKAPEPGSVKTRLAPALGDDGATRLYEQLLIQTIQRFSLASLCKVECHCSPDTGHPVFQALSKQFAIHLEPQCGNDLGERMGHAVQHALLDCDTAVLVGADAPALMPAHISQALSALEVGVDAVVGPAEDGGYVLLGLKKYNSSLFEDIEWGEAKVLETTRQRLSALSWNWTELETLWDLDRPEDLERYKSLRMD